jgi:hypothetical protein
VDGIEVFSSASGQYILVQEDGGNRYGERMFLAKVRTDGTPMVWNFVAQSGGSLNTRMRAGVGVPAGTNGGAGSHEFSGSFDLSGLLHKTGDHWTVAAGDGAGKAKRDADMMVPINDKYITVGLQAHNMNRGVIAAFNCDRGGQLYIYQPNVAH